MENKIIELKDGILVETRDIQNQIPVEIGNNGIKEIKQVEGSFSEIKNLIDKVSDTITDVWKEKESKPDKASVEFGLSFNGKGSIYFVEANVEANVKIKLCWNFSKI